MAGRYGFSVPPFRERDGWFRVGSVDVTTTALIVGLGLVSMFLYAISPDAAFKGVFASQLVRDGDVWRLATWPLVNPPTSIWALLGLAVFWWFGHPVEERIGRVPYTWLVVAMTIPPAAIVTLLDLTNDGATTRWMAVSAGVQLLSLGMIAIFGLDEPNARTFFNIPLWVIAAAYVFIEVLRDVGDRLWAQLILVLLVILFGILGAAQRGMLQQFTFIPRLKSLAGDSGGYAYGEIGSAQRRPKRGRRRGRRGSPPLTSVPTGRWDGPSGPTPLEQAELDVLLDRIAASGIKSLTKQERERLEYLSKRMRGE